MMSSKRAKPSSSSMPWRRASSVLSLTSPATRTQYSRGISALGCIRRWARAPSLVKSRRPAVLRSRRPTLTQRPWRIFGRRSKTLGRPSGSWRVQISPGGLWYIRIWRGVFCSGETCSGRPSRLKRSCPLTGWPISAGLPFTLRRPARIQSSISRREPWPRAASHFWMRSLGSFMRGLRLLRVGRAARRGWPRKSRSGIGWWLPAVRGGQALLWCR